MFTRCGFPTPQTLYKPLPPPLKYPYPGKGYGFASGKGKGRYENTCGLPMPITMHKPLFEGAMTTIGCNTVILIVIILLSLMCVCFVRLCGIDNWCRYYFLDHCASLAFLFISSWNEGGWFFYISAILEGLLHITTELVKMEHYFGFFGC